MLGSQGVCARGTRRVRLVRGRGTRRVHLVRGGGGGGGEGRGCSPAHGRSLGPGGAGWGGAGWGGGSLGGGGALSRDSAAFLKIGSCGSPAREGGSECTVGTRVGATVGRGRGGGGGATDPVVVEHARAALLDELVVGRVKHHVVRCADVELLVACPCCQAAHVHASRPQGWTRRVRLVREGGTRRVQLVREGGGGGGGGGCRGSPPTSARSAGSTCAAPRGMTRRGAPPPPPPPPPYCYPYPCSYCTCRAARGRGLSSLQAHFSHGPSPGAGRRRAGTRPARGGSTRWSLCQKPAARSGGRFGARAEEGCGRDHGRERSLVLRRKQLWHPLQGGGRGEEGSRGTVGYSESRRGL